MLKRKDLFVAFAVAMNEGHTFIGVAVTGPGADKPEIVITHIDNFEAKLEYYLHTYTDELRLVALPSVQIVGFASGNTLNTIHIKLDDMGVM